MTQRTTIIVDAFWKAGQERAEEMGLTMSTVVRNLVRSWVKGEIDVQIKVSGVVSDGDVVDTTESAVSDLADDDVVDGDEDGQS